MLKASTVYWQARWAERLGARPQGKEIADFAMALDAGDLHTAMRARDDIVRDLQERALTWAMVCGMLAVCIGLGLLVYLHSWFWLVPLVYGALPFLFATMTGLAD